MQIWLLALDGKCGVLVHLATQIMSLCKSQKSSSGILLIVEVCQQFAFLGFCYKNLLCGTVQTQVTKKAPGHSNPYNTLPKMF